MDKKFKVYTRAIILSDDKKKLLLIRKNDHQKIGARSWMFPGGTLEWGEDVAVSLVREVKEETNLDISSLSFLAERTMLINDTHWVGFYYLTSVEDMSILKNNEPEKHDELLFVPVDALPDFSDRSVYESISQAS